MSLKEQKVGTNAKAVYHHHSISSVYKLLISAYKPDGQSIPMTTGVLVTGMG